MSASNSTLGVMGMGMDADAYNAFIAALWRGQLYQYVNIATLTVFVVDYIGTLDFEIAYMWPFKFNLVSFLFFLTRYMPVADLVVMTYTERSMDMTQSLCSIMARTYVWLIFAGMAVAEGLLTLRVWALYGKSKKLTAFLLAVYGGSFAASAVTIYMSLSSLQVFIVDIPGLPRLCATKSYNQLLYLYWVFMIVVDAVSCIMLLVQLVSAYKTGGLTNLMKVVYQDGVIFYLVLLCFSVVNIFSIVMLPADISSLLTAPERIIHAVLAGRVVLHTRHQAHEDKMASRITLHTIPSIDAARPEQFSHGGGLAGLAFSTGNYTSPGVQVTIGVQVPSPPPPVRSSPPPAASTPRLVGRPTLKSLERVSPVPPLSLSQRSRSNLDSGKHQQPIMRSRADSGAQPIITRTSTRSRTRSTSGGSASDLHRPLSLATSPVLASSPVCVHRAGGSPVSPTWPAYPTSPTLAASPTASHVFSPVSPTSMVFCASPRSVRESRSTYSCSSASYSVASPSVVARSESILSGKSGRSCGDDVEAEFEFDAVAGPNASFRRQAQPQPQPQQELVVGQQDPVGPQESGPIFEAALQKQRRRQYARIRRSLRTAQRCAVNASVAALGASAGQNQEWGDPGYHLPSRRMATSPYPWATGECEIENGTPDRSGWI